MNYQKVMLDHFAEKSSDFFKNIFKKEHFDLKNLVTKYPDFRKLSDLLTLTENLHSFYHKQQGSLDKMNEIKSSMNELGLQAKVEGEQDLSYCRWLVDNVNNTLKEAWDFIHHFLQNTSKTYFNDKDIEVYLSPSIFESIWKQEHIPVVWRNKTWLLSQQMNLLLGDAERDINTILQQPTSVIVSKV